MLWFLIVDVIIWCLSNIKITRIKIWSILSWPLLLFVCDYCWLSTYSFYITYYFKFLLLWFAIVGVIIWCLSNTKITIIRIWSTLDLLAFVSDFFQLYLHAYVISRALRLNKIILTHVLYPLTIDAWREPWVCTSTRAASHLSKEFLSSRCCSKSGFDCLLWT